MSITPEERAELIRRRPINWDELGSSAKDLWEERHIRDMRKRAERIARQADGRASQTRASE